MNVTDVWRGRSVPRTAVALAAAGALAVEVLVSSPYIARASGTLLHPRWRWLVLAVIAEIASMTTFARLQRQLLAAGGLRVALHRSIALTFASNALSVTLPAGHLVSAGFTFRRLRTRGASIPLIPSGIGVVDGALIVAFVAGGLGTDEATAAVMLYRPISFALIGAIGWAVLFAARYARGTTAPRRPGG
ncbi:hypothetical protein [Rhodococcus opacus]|uniref:hypothetical protein n=1 Tax=Rhodococcus opacus TaxID=37919 RepID=UPI00211E6EA4|nr:hypothetical protein [Rhodococcus opacus]